MANYTTADLLEQIKRKALVPNSQSTFTDAELLSVATDEIHNTILPAVLSTREEFYVYSEDHAVDQTTQTAPIPARAIGLGLREVSFVQGGTERNLPRYDIEDKAYNNGSNSFFGFYIQNNTVYFMGTSSGTMRFYYYLRPSSLVTTDLAAQITAIDTLNNTLTLNRIPDGWVAGNVVDVIGNTAGFDAKQLSNTITDITGLVVTLQDTIDSKVGVNNWVSLEETSPVPQMPVEFFQYLAEAATAYIMESLGDTEGYQRAQQRMQQMLGNAQKIISPRVDGQSKKLVPRRNRGAGSYTNWLWR